MTFIRHEHHWVSGPRSQVVGLRAHIFEHSHELPGIYHRHPCTGPGSFGRSGKPTVKPHGEQLRFIPPEEGEDTFHVVMSEVYTDEHARNKISRADFALAVADFRAVVAGQLPPARGGGGGAIGMTVERLETTFGSRAIYELAPPTHWCGKTVEEHPKTKVGGWRCPEAEEADRERRARHAERTAAELAEMGWAAS